jgi:hypothetical protein
VKAGVAFARATRNYFATVPAATPVPARKSAELKPSRSSWFNLRDLFRPVPAFAFSLLLLVATAVVYQNVVTIPRLRAPQVASFVFLKAARADGGATVVNARRHGPVGLEFVVPPGVNFSTYEAQIVPETGDPVASLSISEQQARQPVQVSVAADTLTAGKYTLIVTGVNGKTGGSSARTEVTRYVFDLRFQD